MFALSERLQALGVTLPPPFRPAATYIGARIVAGCIWVSGMGPTWDTEIRYRGKIGADLTAVEGYAAARLTALNLLSHAALAAGGIDRVARPVKLFGLVNSAPTFHDQAKILDGATDLLAQLFPGHLPARTTVAANALPLSIAVELDAVFDLAI